MTDESIASQTVEWLDPARIETALGAATRAQLAALDVVHSIDSTNTEQLRRGAPAQGSSVLFAERQTGGRGRRGKVWASPMAAHLYMSLACRFSGDVARLGGVSLVAGIAVAEALRGLGFDDVRLKWPNDLVVRDGGGLRKLGGLLVESTGRDGGAVIGIGVNVAMPQEQAKFIDQPWTDLRTLSGSAVSRNRVAAVLLDALLPALAQFDAQGLAPFLPRYAALDALHGRTVNVHRADGVIAAEALGIAEDGALRVCIDGGEQRVHAGEVSVRVA